MYVFIDSVKDIWIENLDEFIGLIGGSILVNWINQKSCIFQWLIMYPFYFCTWLMQNFGYILLNWNIWENQTSKSPTIWEKSCKLSATCERTLQKSRDLGGASNKRRDGGTDLKLWTLYSVWFLQHKTL